MFTTIHVIGYLVNTLLKTLCGNYFLQRVTFSYSVKILITSGLSPMSEVRRQKHLL